MSGTTCVVAIVMFAVIWVWLQYQGAGTGMATSMPIKQGSRDDIYLKRKQTANGIALLSGFLGLLSQLIPVKPVNILGLSFFAIALLALFSISMGLIRLGLPDDDIDRY